MLARKEGSIELALVLAALFLFSTAAWEQIVGRRYLDAVCVRDLAAPSEPPVCTLTHAGVIRSDTERFAVARATGATIERATTGEGKGGGFWLAFELDQGQVAPLSMSYSGNQREGRDAAEALTRFLRDPAAREVHVAHGPAGVRTELFWASMAGGLAALAVFFVRQRRSGAGAQRAPSPARDRASA